MKAPALYNQHVPTWKERVVKIGGMSIMGAAGVLVIALVVVLLVLGIAALVKYLKKK